MLGMMDMIFNFGLNDEIVVVVVDEEFGWFLCDCYCCLLMMYGDVVFGVFYEVFYEVVQQVVKFVGCESDQEFMVDVFDVLIVWMKEIFVEYGKEFFQDFQEQFWGVIGVVFESWDNLCV